MSKIQIPGNVRKFLDARAIDVGSMAAEWYDQDVSTFIRENDIESPIEQYLFIALRSLQEMNCIEQAEPVEIEGEWHVTGFNIRPQFKIGKYRVDFLVTYSRPVRGEVRVKSLVAECDSQEWHERTERERRYEKSRDRFLVVHGHEVFRYTGKEILEQPLRVAAEILAHVVEIPFVEIIIASDYETAGIYLGGGS
jgi:very-short-patch-repair endonuclease